MSCWSDYLDCVMCCWYHYFLGKCLYLMDGAILRPYFIDALSIYRVHIHVKPGSEYLKRLSTFGVYIQSINAYDQQCVTYFLCRELVCITVKWTWYNGRDNFFHITSGRIYTRNGVNQLKELFLLNLIIYFLNKYLKLTNHRYFMI